MENKTPQNEDFVISNNIAKVEVALDIIVFMLSILQIGLTIFSDKTYLSLSLFFLVVSFFITKTKDSYFVSASKKRLKWVIDSSFGLERIPGYDSNKYFDNTDIKTGYKKLFANTHENVLFTSELSSEAYRYYSVFSWLSAGVVLAMFLYFGANKITSILLNAFLTGKLFKRAEVLNNIAKETGSLLDEFNSICGKYNKNKDYEMIEICGLELIIRYETVISENKYVQSERIFMKRNHELTSRWNELKKGYDIYIDLNCNNKLNTITKLHTNF